MLTAPPITILGGGIVGSSIAYELSLAGARSLLLEGTAPATAASGKAGGFLVSEWRGGKVTDRLFRTSFDMHAVLAEKLKLSSYRRFRAYKLGEGDEAAPSWLRGYAQQLSGEAAQVDPAELSAALLREAVASGHCTLRIAEATGIDTAEADGERHVTGVELAGGERVACETVIVALGPWSCLVENWLGLPLPLEGVHSTSLVYEEAGAALAAQPAACFAEADARGCELELYPRPTGALYVSGCGQPRIVSTEELRAGGVPPRAADDPDASRVRAAEAGVAELIPSMGARPSDVQQACMRPCAPDGLPIIGALPGVRGAYVATGHNAWGICWAPVTGRAMAELVLEGEASVVNLRPFAPRRYDTPVYRTLMRQRTAR